MPDVIDRIEHDHREVEQMFAEAGLEGEVDVVVGTLGKALGSYGAYAACDHVTARYLVNSARTLIFSTALSPPEGFPKASLTPKRRAVEGINCISPRAPLFEMACGL